jgi:hypothetical protein
MDRRTGSEGLDNKKKRRRWSRKGSECWMTQGEGDGAEKAMNGWMTSRREEDGVKQAGRGWMTRRK